MQALWQIGKNWGFLLYYGSPCLYVGTPDIWMALPGRRIIVLLGLYTWNVYGADLADALLSGIYKPDQIINSILLVVLFLPFIIGMTVQRVSYI
ncbi:MAG TPA: hypothetical protein VN372_10670 [Methanospirillum sp.]|nr:hypothetical protein [Methanospirillum sp.]